MRLDARMGPAVFRQSHANALPEHRAADFAGVTARRARVLVIGYHCFEDSMEFHVVEALRRMGCTVEFVATRATAHTLGLRASHIVHRVAGLLTREPERLAEPRLLAAAERFEPTLVLVILGNQVSPKSIQRLRLQTRAPIVCWCQDALSNLGRQYLLGAGYDAVFVKDRYMQDLFSRMIRSTRFVYLPEACNPRVHKPVTLSDADRERYGCDVMIAGSLYYYRQEILRQLEGFDLKVWGGAPGWLVNRIGARHMGRAVVLEEKARAARAARIALNPLHYAEVNSLNCRAFELQGFGAFQLVTARPVIAEHFTPGVELETFESADDLIDKIRHYLQHPAQAEAIAQAGHVRAHAEHTYEHRLAEIFRTVQS